MAKRERQLDAVIVGGGVIGMACAWRLAERGARVRVLERDHPGAGASGVAAGMLAPVGEATWGEEGLLRLALRSHAMWPQFARELADAARSEIGFLDLGAVHVALDGDEAEELRRRFDLMRSLGLEAEWLRPSVCREREPGLAPAVRAGVEAPHEAALDPRRAVEALRVAAVAAGADVRVGCEVVEIVLENGAARGARTADAREHRAEAVVLATGAWSGAELLPAGLGPPVRPVKGQILTLRSEPRRAVCERIVVSERVYVVPRGDGRLVVGATVEEMGFDRRVTAGGVHELLREAYRALPEIAEAELVETGAGLRPGTPDNAPIVGRSEIEGLVFATGHYRNGFLLAPVTAEGIAAELGSGEAIPELRAADPGRFELAVAR